MATCKDCLHDDVCPVPHLKDASICPHFKDRGKFVEQKTGRWIETKLNVGGWCSECNHYYEWFEVDEAHFCPHCGAKMNK